MNRKRLLVASVFACASAAILAGCIPEVPEDPGFGATGGSNAGSGGATATGGTSMAGTGGATGTGGIFASGGAVGSGGAATTGGAPGSGGGATTGSGGRSSGGSPGSGGRPGGSGGAVVDAGTDGGGTGGAMGGRDGGVSGTGGRGTGGVSGSGGAGGTVAAVCTSKVMWTTGNGATMRPGAACRQCHSFSIAGTVYPTAHEPLNCNGVNGSTGVRVVITGANGTTLTLTPSAAGNFYSNSAVSMPFTAKVTNTAGGSRAMVAPQTSGDCNSCHTQNGTNSAPGRIMTP